MKYAVKVKLSEDDWIFMTKDTGGNCWDLQPELFETPDEATVFASNLGLKNTVVVRYQKDL